MEAEKARAAAAEREARKPNARLEELRKRFEANAGAQGDAKEEPEGWRFASAPSQSPQNEDATLVNIAESRLYSTAP